tara:strand:- start:4678 stop:5793 length:1116 start_codon:yes stop_codon:yes gene_type:complete
LGKLYAILFLTCTWLTALGQVVNGIYLDNDSIVQLVVTKSKYKLTPTRNEISIPQLTFFERFDDNGRLLEEKDYNLSGTLYAWSFFQYDQKGNNIRTTVLNDDSALNYVITLKYDALNRQVSRKGIDTKNRVLFRSTHTYFKDSTVYVGWITDSTRTSTYVSLMDSEGKKISEIHYSGKGSGKEKVYEAKYTYQDTTLHKKLESYYERGVFTRGTETEYNEYKKTTRLISIDASGTKHVKSVKRYDSMGKLIYDKSFRNDMVEFVFHWEHQYDSLDRITQSFKYCDTSQFRPMKSQLRTKTVFEYLENYMGGIKEVKTVYLYWGLIYNHISATKITRQFDEQGRWLNTTKTEDGELVNYWYAVYTFKERRK